MTWEPSLIHFCAKKTLSKTGILSSLRHDREHACQDSERMEEVTYPRVWHVSWRDKTLINLCGFFFFPENILFLWNRAAIDLKECFNRGAWYNVIRMKMVCVLPQCQSHCLVFEHCSPVYHGRLQDDLEVQCWQPRFREGAWVWAFWAFIFCCKYRSHILPPKEKAEQMVFPSLPPATLKERDICCSTFVAQGQNLQS